MYSKGFFAKAAIPALAVMAVVALAGCASPTAPTTSDLTAFQQIFMSSYYAERGGTPAGSRALTPFLPTASASSRATVNVGYLTGSNAFATPAPTSLADYPEINQVTTFTATMHDPAKNVWDIKATTTYPTGDARSKYVEEYYVRDGGLDPANMQYYNINTPDGKWTVDDPIVKLDGTTWAQDQKARVQQVLTFSDGTTRMETIVAQSDDPTNGPKFAAFNLDGSLDFSQMFYPATDANAVFSSVVIYHVTPPSTTPSFPFWTGSNAQTILGIRYYTELKDTAASKYTSYTISFEKTLSTLTTTGGSFTSTLTSVFVGSQFDTLAESVLRQKTVYTLGTDGLPVLPTAVRTANMKSRVVDITARKDFYLTQLDTDYVTLGAWDTTTIYTPTGVAEEAVAGDPAAQLYLSTRSEIEQADGATIPIATAASGTSSLAILYASLTTGATTVPTTTETPASTIQGSKTQWSFDGTNKGTEIPYAAEYNLSKTGTIETWVYVNQHVDTAGIVHKGILADFSDECFSLQFWGNTGQLAFILDPTTANAYGGYDLVTSTINLNTKKWYHLVATWDVSGTTKTISLYINGTLDRTITPSYTANGCRVEAGANLVIGSQLPSIYNTAYGYFALNGKIVGTRLSAIPMTSADVLSDYNASKDLTSGWY